MVADHKWLVLASVRIRPRQLLSTEATIIRNRGKILATVDNARVMIAASRPIVRSRQAIRDRPQETPRHLADLPLRALALSRSPKNSNRRDTATLDRPASTRSLRT
jgi:hypothetical protein